jgi:sarcosine oxidase gamma subunit
VSAPAFLLPRAAESDGRFHPLRRSSMARRLVEAGAEMAERDGWLVAVRVPGEDAHDPRIRDATHRYAVFEGQAEGELAAAEGELVLRLPAGRAFLARPAAAGGEAPGGLLELSAAYAALEIEGAGAAQTMRRLTDLDLEALPAVGALAHVRGWVFRPEPERYLVFFAQEYGHYLWEVAVDAAEPLGGGPAA